MIRALLLTFVRGWQHLRSNSQLWFVMVLAVVLPLLILLAARTTFTSAIAVITTSEKTRVATVHDAIAVMLGSEVQQGKTASSLLEQFITELKQAQPDIIDIAIIEERAGALYFFAGVGDMNGEVAQTDDELYRTALTDLGESFIYEISTGGERRWRVYRAFELDSARYYIYSEHSLRALDARTERFLWPFYLIISLVIFLILGFAYWAAKQVDYKAKFNESTRLLREHELFTSTIVHELRAPLTAMRGYASMIEETPDLPATTKTQAEHIKQSTVRLVALVTDYLEVTRLRSGTHAITLVPVDILTTVKTVIGELEPSAHEKHLTISVTGPSIQVLSNEKLLTQVCTNLISNAIKYTPSGHIEVTVLDDTYAVELRIKDTGLGMSAEDQARLFAPFSRVGNTATQSIIGSGLGMWITKLIVEELKGTIGVESIKGIGTHVVVRFKK